MAVKLSSLSTEYIRVPVSATENGQPVDPTSSTVEFAFMTDPKLEPTTWYNGSWETAGTTYYARILIGSGAGGTALADGKYYVWLRITGSPEIPVRRVGVLEIE